MNDKTTKENILFKLPIAAILKSYECSLNHRIADIKILYLDFQLQCLSLLFFFPFYFNKKSHRLINILLKAQMLALCRQA